MTPQDFKKWLKARYPEGKSQEKRIALFQREFVGTDLHISRRTVYRWISGELSVPNWIKIFNKKKGK